MSFEVTGSLAKVGPVYNAALPIHVLKPKPTGDDVQYLQKWTSDRLYELRALLLKKGIRSPPNIRIIVTFLGTECRECRSFFKGVLVFSSMCIEKVGHWSGL